MPPKFCLSDDSCFVHPTWAKEKGARAGTLDLNSTLGFNCIIAIEGTVMIIRAQKSLIAVTGVLMAIFLSGCPANGQDSSSKAHPEQSRTVSVQGEGVVAMTPDVAFIDAGVVTTGATAREALARNAEMMNKVFATLQDRGVAERDMQTANLSLSPQYDRRREAEDPLRILGYNVTNRLHLKIRDLASLGEILDAVVSSGINEISGPTFQVDDPSDAREEARVMAVQDAMAKAATLSETAGASLGAVITLTENSSYGVQPQQRTMMMMEAAATPIAAGELEIRVTVSAVFRIE